jgi:signal peptidase II
MQAARGTSLTPSDQHTPPVHTRHRGGKLLLFGMVAAVGYAADLVTKQLALSTLEWSTPVQVVGEYFGFFLTSNSGAAFSLGTSYTMVLSMIAIVAAAITLWVARRLGSTGWAVGLGFLLAGILGNLTDRIFREPSVLRGHVIDFLRFPDFPVFNVADVCINIAAAVIIIQALRGVRVDGTREARWRPGDEETS